MLLLGLLTAGALLLGGARGAPAVATEMVTLNAAPGSTVVFPCDGSAHVGGEEGEEGLFVWEAMGREVAAFKDGASLEGPRYQGRVRLLAGNAARQGEWSLVLEGVTHDDVNMYECMVPGKRTVAIVWLTVDPPDPSTLWVSAWRGDSTFLSCQAPEEEEEEELLFWWEKDGVAVEQDEVRVRVETQRDHVALVISQVLLSDRGVYRCLYTARAGWSPGARSGSPEAVMLTVLGSHLAADETTVAMAMSTEAVTVATTPWAATVTTATAPWASTVTTATAPRASTVTTATAPWVASTTATATPSVTPTETRSSALPSDTAPAPPPGPDPDPRSSPPSTGRPWVLISILAGVLSVTGVTLCILGALHVI